ncbi:hypothetical protein MMC22_004493 [Lobaria immixta]|nr:hypothetical protein [Lobaria immixta]
MSHSQGQLSHDTIASETYTGNDDRFLSNIRDGDYGSDLNGDFDIDEDYAGTESMVTYSTTLSSQRVVKKGSRYKDIYIARCGTQVAAVFHDQIREELIAIANEGGAYAQPPANGREATDTTAFHPDQRDWQEKGVGCPNVLRNFEKPQGFTNPEYDLGFMYYDGFLVIDYESQPLRPFRGIPLTLSSKLEGWRAEAIRRSDPRIRNMDLIARMPVKVEPSANGMATRVPLVKINAVAGRQSRYREQAGAITWLRPTARNVKEFLWALLPEDCKNNSLALPRDLTKKERWELLALNLGKNPRKARKTKADKGMTHEQYIDRVRERAAGGTRDGNARRLRKEGVRGARRESTAETLPDTPTCFKEESEQEFGTLPDVPELPMDSRVSPIADLVQVHVPARPVSAAPAPFAVTSASGAPAAPVSPPKRATRTAFCPVSPSASRPPPPAGANNKRKRATDADEAAYTDPPTKRRATSPASSTSSPRPPKRATSHAASAVLSRPASNALVYSNAPAASDTLYRLAAPRASWPLDRGPVNPLFPFVRPGEYFLDEGFDFWMKVLNSFK